HATVSCILEDYRGHPQTVSVLVAIVTTRPQLPTSYNVLSITHLLSTLRSRDSPFSRGSIIDHRNFCRGEVVPSVERRLDDPVKRIKNLHGAKKRSDPHRDLRRETTDAGVI
ncbi:hypothetical protein ALC60_10172, partial [Trachymyrmex zeteki]